MRIPDEKEIARYLGYHGAKPDEKIMQRLHSVMDSLLPQIEPRQVYRFFDLRLEKREKQETVSGETVSGMPLSAEILNIEGMQIESRALSRNLRGCSSVCLMAATIGMAPDRAAARASASGKMSEAVMIQAVGAALIEAWCDEVNDMIRREASERGYYTRPRFSPGYGDFALEHQVQLFQILGVQKHIGVSLTDSLLMVPTKSVTALIGIADTDAGCIRQGCESCNRAADCAYRR